MELKANYWIQWYLLLLDKILLNRLYTGGGAVAYHSTNENNNTENEKTEKSKNGLCDFT